LVDIGVLKEEEEERAGREKRFIHPKYLQLPGGEDHEFASYKYHPSGNGRRKN